jgi:ubiquinone biosynthesis protein
VLERELGVPWEEVFERIEPVQIAADTIAQVHRAALAGGDRVIVKVQRPDAATEMMRHLALFEAFARDAAVLRQAEDLPAAVEHLSAALRGELDFRQEAANIELMRTVLQPFPRLDVPRVHGDILTARLLVVEEVQGVPVRLASGRRARREAARQLLDSSLRQALTDGFFHADPRPGSLTWRNGRIYFVDVALVGHLDREARELLLLLLLALWQQDGAFLGDIVLMLAGDEHRPAREVEALRRDLAIVMRGHRHASLRELPLGRLLDQLTETCVRHGMRMPASLVLAGRAFGRVRLATAELDPGLRVELRGTGRLRATVQRAGSMAAVATMGGATLLGGAVTAGATRLSGWVAAALGVLGVAIVGTLLTDLLRSRR